MRRTRSMENLDVLPEEAKLAASLLRLTLSEKQEPTHRPLTKSEFQSRANNNQFPPCHRPILVVDKRPEPVTLPLDEPLQPSSYSFSSPSIHHSFEANPARILQKKRRCLQRRCDSSPNPISPIESKALEKYAEPTTTTEQQQLSQSAPAEGQGFLQRLSRVPSFLKKRFSREGSTEKVALPGPAPVIVSAAPRSKAQSFPEHLEKDNSGHFVRQFVRMENNLDNLIFMSMR